MITVQITGLEKLQTLVDPQRFMDEIGHSLDQAAATLRDTTKKMPAVSAKRTGYAALGIPIDTGRMRQAIQKKKINDLSYEVAAKTNYSGFVHEGTSRMPSRPFFKWMLTDFGGLDSIERIMKTALQRITSL